MAQATFVLVRLTVPQLDPLDDPVSIGLAYQSTAALGSSDTGLLTAQVPNLLNVAAAGASTHLAAYLAESMDRAAGHGRVDVYDVGAHLNGTPHGSPVDSAPFTLAATGPGTPMPSGVAAAISFRADYGTDVEFGAPSGVETGRLRPRARDRGRFYLGALDGSTVEYTGAGNRVNFTSQFINDALKNLQQIALISDLIPGNRWSLSVWSRKNAGMKVATELYMDDRPDYQRRRSDPGVKTFLAA